MKSNKNFDVNTFDNKKSSFHKNNLIISENIQFNNNSNTENEKKILPYLQTLQPNIKNDQNHSRQGGEFRLGKFTNIFLIEVVKEIWSNIGKLHIFYEDGMQSYALNVVRTLAMLYTQTS